MDERSYVACIVYLNGNYWGVYELREKVDDHDFTDYYYDQDKNNLQYLKTWGGTWSEYGGPAAQNDWDTFKNFVLSNPMSNQANYQIVKKFMELLIKKIKKNQDEKVMNYVLNYLMVEKFMVF